MKITIYDYLDGLILKEYNKQTHDVFNAVMKKAKKILKFKDDSAEEDNIALYVEKTFNKLLDRSPYENPSENEATYKIIKFRKSGTQTVVLRGLSLTEAQAYCSRPDTAGKNWFCGYTKEGVKNPSDNKCDICGSKIHGNSYHKCNECGSNICRNCVSDEVRDNEEELCVNCGNNNDKKGGLFNER